MKNLKLLYRSKIAVLSNPLHFAVDNESQKLFVSSKNVIESYSSLQRKTLFDIDLSLPRYGCPTDVSIVGLEYLCGEEQLCLALRHGDVALLHTGDLTYECVGTLDCHIASMVWSPDQEIVLLVTDGGNVVAMNHDFDLVSELEISTVTVVVENEFINVGWGSKETQFQGSAGKYVSGKEVTTSGGEFLVDDTKTRIAWRGDSQYFAISCVIEGQRQIRIWNRDFELQYTNENLTGLEGSLAWKPSGALLASTQRKVHRHDVVFFELNGLQHGEFTLPYQTKQVRVNLMQWSPDSKILLIWAEDLLADNREYLQLWICTNYHWTLKQSLELEQKISCVDWDREQTLTLHVLLADGHYCLYRWAFDVNCSSAAAVQIRAGDGCGDQSHVAVVDGAILKLTPFRRTVVPPPMCSYQFRLKKPINSVCFCSSLSNLGNLGVLDNAGRFHTFSSDKADTASEDVATEMMCAGGNGFKTTIDLLHPNHSYELHDRHPDYDWATLRHMLWIEPNTLVCAVSSEHEPHDWLVRLEMDVEKLYLASSIPVTDYVVCLTHSVGHCGKSRVIIQTFGGSLYQCSLDEFKLEPYTTGDTIPVKFPTLCPIMKRCVFSKRAAETNGQEVILALSEQKQLFLDNCVVSTECTSFDIHHDYVLLTTTSHKLVCISRDADVAQIVKFAAKKSPLAGAEELELRRSVERGSVIVAVVPDHTKVVLQMPRGNLEEIHPRALVVSAVKRALDSSSYEDAFALMRKHRINMNLLHDHDPGKFIREVPLFVQQLRCSENINLFLGDLSEEIVTKTLYKHFYSTVSTEPDLFLEERVSKTNTVCDLILSELVTINDSKYTLSILTTHVRKSTPDISAALNHVKALKSTSDSHSAVSDALKYLHVLVDGRILYKEALATYDLELALLVAQVSNNDPKEYLPFLNELKASPESYMKYKIDMHLKNYSKAVANLAQCPEHFDQCVELVKAHDLYREALDAFAESPKYREVVKLYAEYLTSLHRYEEAGVMLARSSMHKQAVKCFIESCSWQQALACAQAANLAAREYRELAVALANSLTAKNRHQEAAMLLAQEANDPDAAISLLIKSQQWADAVWHCQKSQRSEVIASALIPALQEAQGNLTNALESQREHFNRYYARLIKVREMKQERLLKVVFEF